jgi:predicted metal-dependent enzyme (double-stranded beta helix superfamily)
MTAESASDEAGMSAPYTARDCAGEIAAAIDRHGGDPAKLGEALRGPIARLAQRPDLLELGAPRAGNNVDLSYYLYFDGQLSIILYRVPKGKTIPAHDHGIWETVSVYRGSMRHVVYERTDDGDTPGRAELRAIDDRVLEPGDLAIVSPPADIHSFTALDDDTYGITVVNGSYKPDRHYYQPETNTYTVKGQRNTR